MGKTKQSKTSGFEKMVSRSLLNNARAIVALSKASEKVRTTRLEKADKELVLALVECAKNIINGNVQLTRKQFACLYEHKHTLRRLCKGKTPLQTKKKYCKREVFCPS